MARFLLKIQGCRMVRRCDASDQEPSARENKLFSLFQDVRRLRPTAWSDRNVTQARQRGMVEEVDPTLMFVPKTRRYAALAMFLAAVAGLTGSAEAQRDVKSALEQRNLRQRVGANAVPLKRMPTIGDARFIPADITRRSLVGVPGFDQAGKSRVQIGGVNGTNVVEQVVNATNSVNTDQRTPFWTSDEASILSASKPAANQGYQIARYVANPTASSSGPSPEVLLTNEPAADHLFPTMDANGNRVAFIKSTDGKAIDDPTKSWHLYVSFLPAGNGTIDTNPGGPTGLLALTMGRSFRGQGFASVGRAAWVGTGQLIFSARLIGETESHLFVMSLSGFQVQQLTSGLASEQNPAVSPDFRWVAFDSNATPGTTGSIYTNGTLPATETNAGDPARAPSVAAVRNIFTMPIAGTAPPAQFTGRFTGAPAVNNLQPAWSGNRQNPFTNAGGARQYLAFSSNRTPGAGGVTPGTTSDIYIAPVTSNAGATIQSENTATAAVLLDTQDPSFSYNDQYPAWGPFVNVTRLALQSDRTGSQRTNNFGVGFTGTPAQRDLFMASMIDINAPSLVRFDTSTATGEIVHINLGTTYNAGNPVRTREDGLAPGSTAFFTVRAEDREAGLRLDNDTNGGAVYIQFKNPNSIFQSIAQGGPAQEFKEYIGTSFTLVEQLNGANITIPFINTATGAGPGHEFDAKVVTQGGGPLSFLTHTVSGGPVYTPGIDDQIAFSASGNPVLDGRNGTNCWVKLNKLADQPADGQGGVLYGAAVTLPNISSDWYMDVILYDNAVNPYATSGRGNWIIYDNIWGFSTALAPNPTLDQDILFVSDYTLGQKFFASRFGQSGIPINQQPIFFGAESYLTDTDLSRYPGEAAGQISAPSRPTTGTPVPRFYSNRGPFFRSAPPPPQGLTGTPRFSGGVVVNPTYPNTLGVGSYVDESLDFTPSITLSNGFRYALPTIGRYSIWRVLSRGTVPPNIIDAYLPRTTITPADTVVNETTPRTTRIWNRMVVWSSPFSGNLFVGPGSITELRSQDMLSRFVRSGGRLFITGSDIGFALAGNGQTNDFFQNVLQANFGQDQSFGRPTAITPTGETLVTRDPFRSNTWGRAYGGVDPGNGIIPYSAPSAGPTAVTSLNAVTGTADRGDGSPVSARDQAFIDLISVRPSPADLNTAGLRTRTDFTYDGQGAIITAEYALTASQALNPTDPYAAERKFTSGGSATFSSVGLESVSHEFYSYTPQGAQFEILSSLGRRSEIMANIVGAYRTGTIQGKVIDDQGSPVPGVLMRAVRRIGEENLPAWGTAISDGGGNFVISGLPSEAYVVYGYLPGYYTQHTVGILVQGGGIFRGDLQLKRAAPGRLRYITPTGTTGLPPSGILDSAGQGIPGIEVQLRRQEPAGGTTTITAVSNPGDPLTPAGAYEFDSLLIGQYEIFVNWPTVLDNTGTEVPNPRYNAIYQSIHVTSNPQDGVVLGPGTVLVPGPGGVGIRLQIAESQTSTMNFVLTSAPQPVTGRVIDAANGQGIEGADVAATDAATGTIVATATTDANGNYQLQTVATPPSNGIPAATYTVTAGKRGYASNSVNVIVSGGTPIVAPTIALSKVPGGGVRGLVNSTNGNGGLPGVTVKLFYIKQDGTTDPTPTYTTTTGAVQTDSTGFVYNFDFAVPSIEIGDYLVTFEKDGLVSNPVQVRITVTSNNITRLASAVRMESPRVYGTGIQLLSVPFDYSGIPGFASDAPYSIFSLGAGQDNNGDGVVNAQDAAIFSTFNVADWTGVEYRKGNNIPILVGKGYFVRFGEVANVARVGNVVSNSSFTLNLAPGWNLIGHPFANATNPSQPAPDLDINSDIQVQDGTAAPVSMAQAVRDGLVKSSVFGYTGSENGSQYIQTTTIKPWLGYWFRNVTTRPLKLIYSYPTTRAVSRRVVAKTLTRAEAEAVAPRQITSRDISDYRLQLAARQGNLLDTDNTVGVARDARDGYDNAYDNQKPPVIAQVPAISLAIEGTDETGSRAAFADQIRAPGGKKSWDVTVQAPRDGEVTLYWPNVNRLPRGIQPMLVDVATGRRTSLRSAASYRFNATQGTTRKFRVEIGPARTAPLAIVGTRVVNVGGTRGANSGYRFAFTATQEADVQVEIQTLTGRTLKRLETRATAGGESGVFWDGRTAQGAALPAGPYVVTISARDSEGTVVRASLPLTKVR